jgi:uncharacterized protein YcfL
MLTIKKSLLAVAATALLAGTFLGCSIPTPNYIGKKTVRVDNQKKVQEGQFLKVIFEFVNENNSNTEGMVYQVEWLDANGVLKDSTPWKPLTITKQQRITVVEMTTLPDIKDYRIQVSTPNK